MFDGDAKGKVSLGGRRNVIKSKEQVLEQARQRREQRTAAAKPSKAAVTIQRHTRGQRTRRHLLAVLTLAVRSALGAVQGDATESLHESVLSLERRIGLLWSACERWASDQEMSLIELSATVMLDRRVTHCVCHPSMNEAGWLRRQGRLMRALLSVPVRPSAKACSALALALCSAALSNSHSDVLWTPCCQPRAPPVARALLNASAMPIAHALRQVLLRDQSDGPMARMDQQGTCIEDLLAHVESLASLGRALLYDSTTLLPSHPTLYGIIAAQLPPVAIVATLATPIARHAWRVLFRGLSAACRRRLEEAVAVELTRHPARRVCGPPSHGADGAIGTARDPGDAWDMTLGHEAAAVAVGALLICVEGEGSDWRRGGWTEGRPRLLSREELSALMVSQVTRMRQICASAAAEDQDHTPLSNGRDAMKQEAALVHLMRMEWELPKAVFAARNEISACNSELNIVAEAPPTAPSTTPTAAFTTLPTATSSSATGTNDESASDVSALNAMKVEEKAMAVTGAKEAGDLLGGGATGECGEIQIAGSEAICGICFDTPAAPNRFASLSCGHCFCLECWGQLLSASLARGPACVNDKCPQPQCEQRISATLWADALNADGHAKLHRLATRQFVRFNSLLHECPSASCGHAAAHITASAPPEVPCVCGTAFCVLCGEPPHWPASCARKRRWLETLHQSPDASLVASLTRPCPSCGVRTQRAAGCMHITCTQCSSEWCWGCGQVGKRGEVHHVHQCSRRPDPKWKFVTEDMRNTDGSLSHHLDEWLYRKEQCELLVAAAAVVPAVTSSATPSSTLPAASNNVGECAIADREAAERAQMAPAYLRPLLLRALSVLRWMEVYLHASPGELPSGPRCAHRLLSETTDALYSVCHLPVAAQPTAKRNPGVDWAALSSLEMQSKRAWLVVALLYLGSHLRAGPQESE